MVLYFWSAVYNKTAQQKWPFCQQSITETLIVLLFEINRFCIIQSTPLPNIFELKRNLGTHKNTVLRFLYLIFWVLNQVLRENDISLKNLNIDLFFYKLEDRTENLSIFVNKKCRQIKNFQIIFVRFFVPFLMHTKTIQFCVNVLLYIINTKYAYVYIKIYPYVL